VTLPGPVRRLAPDRLRDDVRLRALAVGTGLIPPRAMHAPEEAALLVELALGRRRVVEIGVYEGASAARLVQELGPETELHLIDPFGRQPGALPRNWAGVEWATRRTVDRTLAGRGGQGPRVVWHVERSEDTARGWEAPVDLVFVDGDHLEPGVRLDWECWHRHVVPGGHVLFHDARASQPGGRGLPGPTAVVDELFRGAAPLPGWELAHEVDRSVAVRRLPSAR